jgi:amino acid adenylation domain-containing protein
MGRPDDLSGRITPHKLQLLRAASGAAARVPSVQPASDQAADAVVPTSYMQRGMWFLDQLLKSSERSAYNVPVILRLRGALDVEILEECLSEIIRRHEVLRTVIVSEDGNPVQVIRPAGPCRIPVSDVSGCPDQHVETVISTEVSRVFDLAKGPLFRTLLVRRSSIDTTLVLTFHHAVFDGYSFGVLFDELRQLYSAFSRSESSPLAQTKAQYRDYAKWQQDMEDEGLFAAQLEYWKRELGGASSLLDMPTDRPRPAVASYAGGQFEFVIPAAETSALRELARAEQATPFIVILASYQALLSRWTGQADICIGCGTAGRSRSDWDGLIGCFVNALVIRAEVSPDMTFRELVRRARTTSLAAYDNQDVPFEQLVERLRPDRTLSYNPLYQTALVWQPLASGGLSMPGIEVEELPAGPSDSKGDLVLDIAERAEDLAASLGFRQDLFEVGSVERLAARYRVLLTAVGADPDIRIGDIDLLLPGESMALTNTHHGATRPLPRRTLPTLIEANALAAPDAIAITDGQIVLTYRQLNEQANQLAHLLIATIGDTERGTESSGGGCSIAPDHVIAVALPPTPRRIITLLAILKAGAAYLALDPAQPPTRIAHMLRDASPACVITDDDHTHLVGSAGPVLQPDHNDLARQPTTNPRTRPSPHNLAYVIYTSGTTSQPKPVAVEHSQVVSHLEWMTAEFSVSSNDVVLGHMSPSFDASVGEIWLSLMAGAALCVAPKEILADPVPLLKFAEQHGVTIAQIAPSLLAAIPAQAECATLRQVITGGEPLPTELARHFASRWNVSVASMYGPTETTVAVTCCHYNSLVNGHTVPLGRPVWNTQLYVLDPRMRPVIDGATGELYIGGAQVARGYRDHPGITAERFVPDFFGGAGGRLYRSGDICRWRSNGQLEHVGRLDHQIKVRGYRIEPGEIEAALTSHPSIRRALVVAREDSPGDRRLIAYMVLATDAGAASPDTFELREWLGRSLPSYMIPSAFVTIDSWPATMSGKIDRAALPRPDLVATAVYERPTTQTEELVAATWRNVLQADSIGVNDNFFDLGGHSLSAVRMFSHLASRFGRAIPVTTIFAHPTVRQLATWLEASVQGERETLLVPIQTAGTEPPLFLVHPVGGNVLCYGNLARQLGSERPVYGIAAKGFDGLQEPVESVNEMAASYLAAIAAQGYCGPYILGGWSIGGVIAYEMARQVQRETSLTTPVVMIDTSAKALLSAPGETAPYERVDATESLSAGELLARFGGLDEPEIDEDVPWLAERLLRVIRANVKAIKGYRPDDGYRGPILLLSAQDSLGEPADPSYGWGEWTTGKIDARIVPGDHFSMLQEPNLPVLADQLQSALEEL